MVAITWQHDCVACNLHGSVFVCGHGKVLHSQEMCDVPEVDVTPVCVGGFSCT